MLTRRQFLTGVGATAAVTVASLLIPLRGKPQASGVESTDKPPELIPECDWIIDNVLLVDGTGDAPYFGKIAVQGEYITAVGEFQSPEGVRKLDGQGLVLTPGFIDIHTHTEDYLFKGGSMAPFLAQGVTTQIGGNCGLSPENLNQYIERLSQAPINYGLLMGYKTIRYLAMGGHKTGKASPAVIEKMCRLMAAGMETGAFGLSTGLEYYPQHDATTEELIRLCGVVGEHGGFYATHIRSEYDQVESALEEAVEIGLQARIPVQYSHIKAGYERNWDKFPRLLEILEEAKKTGLDITADVYPYTFSSTDLGRKTFFHSMSEENVKMAMSHPQVFFGSDSQLYEGGRAYHPRAYGVFPRVLGRMVREEKVLSLQEAVAKMTAQPAKRLKLKDRGFLKPGFKADLVLFDQETVTDVASINNPSLFSEGIRQVWVNGKLAFAEGEVLEAAGGQFIRGVSAASA